jgi:hypothetical protein
MPTESEIRHVNITVENRNVVIVHVVYGLSVHSSLSSNVHFNVQFVLELPDRSNKRSLNVEFDIFYLQLQNTIIKKIGNIFVEINVTQRMLNLDDKENINMRRRSIIRVFFKFL